MVFFDQPTIEGAGIHLSPRNAFEQALLMTGDTDLIESSYTLAPSTSSAETSLNYLAQPEHNLWQWLASFLDKFQAEQKFLLQNHPTILSDLNIQLSREMMQAIAYSIQSNPSSAKEVVSQYQLGIAALNKIAWIFAAAKSPQEPASLRDQASSIHPDSLSFAPNNLNIFAETIPGMTFTSLTLRTEFLLRALLNQHLNDINSTTTKAELRQFYHFISGKEGVDIHGSGASQYTDREIVTELLETTLSKLNLSPNTKALIVGIGDGTGPDTIAAKTIGAQITGIDLVSQQLSLNITFSQADFSDYVAPSPFNLLEVVGSSLLNQKSLLEHCRYWLKITSLLTQEGICLYEVGALEPRGIANYLHNMAISFNSTHPDAMMGDIARRPAYRQSHETDNTFGAHIFPDPITRLFAELSGLTCDQVQYYQVKRDAHRALYTFRKTGEPHPLLEAILSSFARAPATDQLQA